MATATKEEKDLAPADARKQSFTRLKEMFRKKKGDIARVGGKGMDVDRMIGVALLSVRKNPKLLECSMTSVVASVLEATMMGIIPGDGTRKGDLIPYWNSSKKRLECQFQPRYGGFIYVAKNGSPEFGDVQAHVVYEKDEFNFKYGTAKFLDHIPSRQKEKGPITHFYMVVYFTNNTPPHFDVMTLEEVEATRDKAPNYMEAVKHKDPKDKEHWKYERAMWVKDFVEMGKKTVIKRGLKVIPWGNEKLSKLADLDDRVEALEPQDTVLDLEEDDFQVMPTNEDKAKAADEAAKAKGPAISLGDPVVPEEAGILADWTEKMKQAGTVQDLTKALNECGKAKMSEPTRKQLGSVYAARLAELKKGDGR